MNINIILYIIIIGFTLFLLGKNRVVCMQVPPYTIAEIKLLLRKNAIEPGNVFMDPQHEVGICNCNQTLVSVASLPDTYKVYSDIVLGYPQSEILNCKKNEIFSVHRIMLNQTATNRGVCKYGHFSRDLSDAHILFPSKRPDVPKRPEDPSPSPKDPKDPIPKDPKNPKTPNPKRPPPDKPDPPQLCPNSCVDLINQVPRGPQGPAGPPGPPGPPGIPGRPPKVPDPIPPRNDTTNGYYGYAPPRKGQNLERSFADLKRAFTRYTGCTVEESENHFWNVNLKRQTDCKVLHENWKELKAFSDTQPINTGYVIIWFWWNHEGSYTNAFAYREKENDIIPVLCGHDPSPVFLPQMVRNKEDIQCSPRQKPSVKIGEMIGKY